MDTPKNKQKPETVHLDIETVSEDGNTINVLTTKGGVSERLDKPHDYFGPRKKYDPVMPPREMVELQNFGRARRTPEPEAPQVLDPRVTRTEFGENGQDGFALTKSGGVSGLVIAPPDSYKGRTFISPGTGPMSEENKALQAAGRADRMPPRPPVFISAADPAVLKKEMTDNRGLNLVIEAENPVQAVAAKRNAVLGGKTVQVINDFHEPAKQEAREAAVKAFREAAPGTSVLIYVRPPSPALTAIMEDHPEIKEEMSSKLSDPSDLLS